MLIYDFIADICNFISLVWPYPVCARTVTKRKGPFRNLVFLSGFVMFDVCACFVTFARKYISMAKNKARF